MLFKLEKDKSVFESNPELEIIEEFSKLTDKQMIVVILVADYKSPLRSLPDRTKREKACMVAGYTMEEDRLSKNARDIVYGNVKSIETAIKKYKELQYDENKETLEAIDAQINEAIAMMKMDKFEACKVEKVTTRPDGTSIKTSYIDSVAAVKLAEAAVKLGIRLKELKETKLALLSLVEKDEQPSLSIPTYTAADIEAEEGQEGLSVIDMFNKSKIENNAVE